MLLDKGKRTEIKICGLRTVEDVKMINEFDVDYVGYVFAKSKRQVSVEEVLEMNKHLKSSIKKVGVFADMCLDEVNDIAEKAELDIIQLHSNESSDECKKAVRPVWKSVSVKDDERESVLKYLEYENVSGILFDTYVGGENGGSGKVFDWNMLDEVDKNKFIILAGGLTVENVGMAVKNVVPKVVDVSSGVETLGVKDRVKVEKFVEQVRNAKRDLEWDN